MNLMCCILILASASARPHRNSYEEDSSPDDKEYETDNSHSLREDKQNSKVQETDQRVTEDQQHHVVDYGGNTFLQRARSQPAAPSLYETSGQGLSEENEEATPDEAAEEQAHKDNYAELRMRSKNRDNYERPNNKVSLDKLALKTDEQDSDDQEGLTVANNVHNGRQAQHNRDEKIKTKLSQYSTSHSQTARVPVENNPRNKYEGSLKLRNDKINDQPSVMTSELLSDAAEYEDGSPKYADNNEDVPLQEQKINSFGNNRESANYESSNLDLERARDRRNAINEIDKASTPEGSDSKADQSKSQETLDGVGEKTGPESVEIKEQLAIKRHIANLSHDQLNELLASLPTDKKELLQEIMSTEKADINKRDVTKRDGVLEQDKDQVESVSVSLQQCPDKIPETEINQGTGPIEHGELVKNMAPLMENQEISSNKETGDNPLAESTLTKNDDSKNNDLVKNEDIAKANDQLTNFKSESGVDKSNIKREISANDYNSPLEESEDNLDLNAVLTDETSNESSFVGSNNEEISNDAELNKDVQLFKRDASQDKHSQMDTLKGNIINSPKAELSILEQLQALQDSFPGVRSYDETIYHGQHLSPLVRVKRNKRHANITKRSAAILPVAKEPNVPYRADTDDEDDEEGNEFEDEGFFDKTSSLGEGRVRSDSNRQNLVASESESASNETSYNADQTIGNDQYNYIFKDAKYYSNKVPQNTIGQDLSSVGSDTDNVLSGSEGVDENLMLTSAARSRLSRDSDKDSNSVGEENDELQLTNSKKAATEELESVQNDPNGAFGGLPNNYDGVLSRIKRIRRTDDTDPVA